MNVEVFEFKGAGIRTVEENGEILFMAKDVCNALGLENVTWALDGLDEDDLTSLKLKSGGQLREMKALTEPGIYALIFKSRKPEAKAFQNWVTKEVLPTIRKKGVYTTDKDLQASFERQYAEKVERLQGRIEKLEMRSEQDRKEAKLEMREDMQRMRLFLELYTRKVSVYDEVRQDVGKLYAAYIVFCETHKKPAGPKSEFDAVLAKLPGKKYIYDDKRFGNVVVGRAFEAATFEYHYGEKR